MTNKRIWQKSLPPTKLLYICEYKWVNCAPNLQLYSAGGIIPSFSPKRNLQFCLSQQAIHLKHQQQSKGSVTHSSRYDGCFPKSRWSALRTWSLWEWPAISHLTPLSASFKSRHNKLQEQSILCFCWKLLLHRAKQTTENLSKQFRVWNFSFLTISREPMCISFHSCLVQREVKRVTTLILDTNWLLVLHCWSRERRLWSQSNERDYTAIREQRQELERRAESRENIP